MLLELSIPTSNEMLKYTPSSFIAKGNSICQTGVQKDATADLTNYNLKAILPQCDIYAKSELKCGVVEPKQLKVRFNEM